MKVSGLLVAIMLLASTTAWGQLFKIKERNPGYIPHLHQSRTSIIEAIGPPGTLYLPEFDTFELATRGNVRTWLSTPVAETYRREYGGVPFTLDIFYAADNYRAGIIGPMRAIGFSLTSTAQVHYPAVLPTIPWFKEMCASDCDAMEYKADGQTYSLVCPAYPRAPELAAALLLPRTLCLRADLTDEHPGFLIIHYAEFLPAAEELMAEGPVQHCSVNMEGVQGC